MKFARECFIGLVIGVVGLLMAASVGNSWCGSFTIDVAMRQAPFVYAGGAVSLAAFIIAMVFARGSRQREWRQRLNNAVWNASGEPMDWEKLPEDTLIRIQAFYPPGTIRGVDFPTALILCSGNTASAKWVGGFEGQVPEGDFWLKNGQLWNPGFQFKRPNAKP